MKKYIIKRLLMLIPIILGVVLIVFFIMSLTPGSPGQIILGSNAKPEAIASLNHELGFDKPFIQRYLNYVLDAARGDFGESYFSGKPVFNDIFFKFPTTFTIAFFSVFFASVIGIPLGIFSAIRQYSAFDIAITIFALLMASVPSFWFGLMMILVFSLQLGWLPSFGIGTVSHYVLPVACMALPTAAGIMRLTRSTMLETIKSDYIRTARAKGAKESSIIWKHSLKNALLPVITVLGMSFAGLLGGSIFIEKVFSIPGLGGLMLSAIVTNDVPVVMGCTIFLATLFCSIMLVLDIIYSFIDPRIKARFGK